MIRPAPIAARFRHRLGGSATAMLSNSGYLVLTTIATAGLGFAFWWFAARGFTPHAVGIAAATVSTMSLLGYVAMLGLGTILIARIHAHPGREGAYVVTAMAVSGIAGLSLGAAVALLASHLSPELGELARTAPGLMLFAAGVSLTAGTLVLDQALVGLLRARWQFYRNAVFAAGKLVVLAALGLTIADASAPAIVLAWVLGIAMSLAPLAFLSLRPNRDLRRFLPDPEVLGHMRAGMLSHHALNLSLQAPSLALPVLVAVLLSPESAAYFYTAWMVAGFVSVGTSALAMTLYSVGSRDPAQRARSMRLALGVSITAVVAAIAGLVILGPWILGMFGAAYAGAAQVALIVLALAALPGIMKAYFVQVCRFDGRLGIGAAILATGAIVELAAAAAGGIRGGIAGVATGFAIATAVEAVIMGPTVLRFAGLVPRWSRPLLSAADPSPG